MTLVLHLNHLKSDGETMNRSTCVKRSLAGAMTLLACSIGTALQAQNVDAATRADASQQQAPPDEVHKLEGITVTGTNILGSEPVGNTVEVFTAEEIMDSGNATLVDFLRDLPANFLGGVATATNVQGGQRGSPTGGNLSAGQGVNLRGLGVLSTLVLIDGRRIAPSGQFGAFVDIANIPLSAVARIEILKDGASAVYGSDAVAGVVNVILKRGADGFAAGARVGTTAQGGGTQTRATATWGSRWGTGNIFMGVEVREQERIAASDRDVFNGGDFRPYGGVNWPRWSGRVGRLANIFVGAPNQGGTVARMVPAGDGTGLTLGDLIPAPDGVGYTHPLWQNVDIMPKMNRQSAFLAFNQDVASNVSLYGDVILTHREADFNKGYAAVYARLPSTSPYYIPGSSNAFSVLIDDVGLKQLSEVDSYFLDFGADFRFAGDWHANADVSWSQQDQSRSINFLRRTNVMERLASGKFAPSSLSCALMGLGPEDLGALPGGGSPAQRYCAQLGYQAFNPYSSQPLSDQVLSELIGYGKLQYSSWIGQANFQVNGSLFQLPAGAVRFAGGVGYRLEHIEGELDFNYRSIQPHVVPYSATERDVVSAYAEFLIPVIGHANAMPGIQELNLSVAGRYEKSSGLAGFKTFNPKFGFTMKPVDSLTLRGSWGTSFHAPPMRYMYNGPQPVQGGNAIFTRADLYTAPCDTTVLPLNGVIGTPGGTGNCSFTAMVVVGGAGPTLDPEESTTWTLGMEFAPESLSGFHLGVDYYNITIEQRLQIIQARQLARILSQYFATGSTPYKDSLAVNPGSEQADALFNDPRYLGQFGRGPTQSADDVAMIVYATQTNLGSMETSGLDINASYNFNAGAGYFKLFAKGTRVLEYRVRSNAQAPWVDQLGLYTANGTPLPWQARAGVAWWSNGGWNLRLTGNYTDGFECLSGCFVPGAAGAPKLATDPIEVGGYTTFDLNMGYQMGVDAGWLSNTRFNFSVINLFDRNAPFFDTGTPRTRLLPMPFNPATSSIMGRTLSISVNKQW